jgi:hypothetical protein
MGLLDRLTGRKPPTTTPPPALEQASFRVQILLPRAPSLDPSAIHVHLRSWRDDVGLIGGDPSLFGLAIPAGGPLPIFVHVFTAAPDAFAAPLRDALTWTQTWRERAAAVARARASVVLAMPIDAHQPHAVQLLALLAVLDTVLVSLDERDAEQAIVHWMPAQQLLPFARYRMLRKELGPSGPAVNVRIANVGGAPGEMFADTLGLAALGLPDLQARFRRDEREPNEVAMRMLLLARQLFLGEELDGAAPAPWLAPPERATLTITL